MRLLNVYLSVDENIIAKCSYMVMDAYSTTFDRVFVFNKPILSGVVNVNDLPYQQKVEVHITVNNSSKIEGFYTSFQIIAFDSLTNKDGDLIIRGYVEFIDGYYSNYNQTVVDILNSWQQGEDVIGNWYSTSSAFKGAYFTACRLSNANKNIKLYKCNNYTVNLLKSISVQDVIFEFSHVFYDNKGYLGYNEFTFFDCLLTLLQNNGLKDKQITIIVDKALCTLDVAKFVSEIAEWCMDCGIAYNEIAS